MKTPKLCFLRVALIGFCVGYITAHTACTQAVQSLSVTTVESGLISGKIETGLRFLVISEPEAFGELYGQIASLTLPKPTIPAVDFAKYRVVVAFMGEKPTAGYGIRFAESARQRAQTTIEVQILRTMPPKDAILAQVVTNPYVVAMVARNHYTEVVFVDELGAMLASVDVD